jgi:hypothetical protein
VSIETSDLVKEIQKLKNLLALQLYHNGVPPLNIAKAAGMSPNELYKFITKKKSEKAKTSKKTKS